VTRTCGIDSRVEAVKLEPFSLEEFHHIFVQLVNHCRHFVAVLSRIKLGSAAQFGFEASQQSAN
jgi:hypothetical protein